MTIEEHDMKALIDRSFEELKLVFKDIKIIDETEYFRLLSIFQHHTNFQNTLQNNMRQLLHAYMWGHLYAEPKVYSQKINEIISAFMTKNGDEITKLEKELKKSLKHKFCSL